MRAGLWGLALAGPLALAAALAPSIALAHDAKHGDGQAPAASQESPRRFEPPPAGSYSLPPITRVAEHTLVDHGGRSAGLPALAPGQVEFVAFVYLSCPAACPRTLGVLQRLDRELAEDAALRERIVLSVVSFDPVRDTPEALAGLRERLGPRGSWRFLTAPGRGALEGLLRDYGQDAVPLFDDATGEPTGLVRHVLKVFLIDSERRVRNIYSSEFLDWRLLRNDALTVLEEGA